MGVHAWNHPRLPGLTDYCWVGSAGVAEDLWRDAFVGRQRELTALAKLLEASRGSMRSAFVEGEAGIGKTRLISEFLQRVRHEGIRVVQGCCYHVEEAGPYFPFFQILRQLGLADSDARALLESLVAGTRGGRSWNHLSEDVRARRAQFLRTLSDAILQEAASEATLVYVEDVQWADIGSLLVLNNLLDCRAAGLLIISTARVDEPIELDVGQLVARIEEKSRRIVLRGLNRAEIRELVRHLSGESQIADEELQAVELLTGGNPLFLREMILHLRDIGILDRHTVAEAARRSRTPDRLSGVIDLRLRSLPADVKATLSASSVIGTEFSAALIAQAASMHEGAVADHLESCVSKGILQPVDALGASHFRFVHPLFPMRLYGRLAPSERRRLHREVAEAAASGSTTLAIDEVARHYALGFGTAGGRKGVNYCQAAARRAESVLAYETAARFWELALTCAGPRSRRTKADLYRRLGWALWAANNWTRASEAWREAVRLFEALGDSRSRGKIALALGDIHRWRQELAESEGWLEQALELLPDGSADRRRALALLGSIRCLQDEPGLGLQLLEEASKATHTDDRDPLVEYWLSYGFMVTGDQSKAYAVARDGLDVARRQRAATATCLLAGTLVHYELSLLRVGSARSYARLVDDAVDPADATALTRSLVCRALLGGYAGRWKRVLKLCERWMAKVRLAGRYHVATARVFWAEAMLALGDASAAESAIRRALPDLGPMRPLASLHLARVLLRLGKNDEAASIVSRYPQPADSSQRSVTGRALLAEVASELDDPGLWRRCYDSLCAEDRPIVVVYSPISVRRVLGRLAGRLHLWSDAIEHFDVALQQLSDGKAHWELAQTYLDYAEMRHARRRRGDIRKAAALALEADAIFNALGIQRRALERISKLSTDGNRFGLTGREMEVLILVAEGRRNQEIAETLTLSSRTVERHLENIFGKMRVSSRTEAVMQAVREGFVGRSSEVQNSLPHAEFTAH